MRQEISRLVGVRARPIIFSAYLLWGDVVEIDGHRHRFDGVLRRFRSEQDLVEYILAVSKRYEFALEGRRAMSGARATDTEPAS